MLVILQLRIRRATSSPFEKPLTALCARKSVIYPVVMKYFIDPDLHVTTWPAGPCFSLHESLQILH
jgi:hypothetical protein